jgi:NUMOD1 domain-containing protein/GIY-YIG catalytic domain-containing protein/NUMOD3 motif-containing protein
MKYNDIRKNKFIIYKENKNKAGIYIWENIITGEIYVGSSGNLGKRFSFYFSKKALTNVLSTGNSNIYSNILKYGLSNFSLQILEYIDLSIIKDKDLKKKVLWKREDYYSELLKPEYNILTKAGSSLGRKHTPEARLKMSNAAKGRVCSKESREKLRVAAEARIGICIQVYDKSLNLVKEFPSKASTALHFNISARTVSNYLNKDKSYKGFTFISSKY